MSGYRDFNINGSIFRLDARYEIIKPIGHGAYGLVVSARDHTTGREVAIKKIPNAFANLKDTKRTLREIKLLAHFEHDNVLELIDLQRPLDRLTFNELYIVTGLMETDLHQVISSQQRLSEKHAQYFLYQILRGVKYIHSCNVLHRDLKPSNLLVNSDCSLRICDFGLARFAMSLDDDVPLNEVPLMTEYVATRWYRAPEVILSWKQYTKAIDLWSVGCIFAELLNRKPLFQGFDYMHQVNKVVETMGTPSKEDLSAVHNVAARQYIEGLGYHAPINWQRAFPTVNNPYAFDLLSKLLQFNPAKRISAEAALAHPYLAALHEPNDEPVAKGVFNFDFENFQLNIDQYRELIYQETLKFHPDDGSASSSSSQPTSRGGDDMDLS